MLLAIGQCSGEASRSRQCPAGRLVVHISRSHQFIQSLDSCNRLIREGYLSTQDSQQAFTRLNHLRQNWNEIQPGDDLRDLAERLLGRHKLRAGDAFQLAAALVWCTNNTKGRRFISGDDDLLDAAESEGFTVILLQ